MARGRCDCGTPNAPRRPYAFARDVGLRRHTFSTRGLGPWPTMSKRTANGRAALCNPVADWSRRTLEKRTRTREARHAFSLPANVCVGAQLPSGELNWRWQIPGDHCLSRAVDVRPIVLKVRTAHTNVSAIHRVSPPRTAGDAPRHRPETVCSPRHHPSRHPHRSPFPVAGKAHCIPHRAARRGTLCCNSPRVLNR